MSPATYFALYLITLPDIEAHQHTIQRLVFSYKEDCIEMAQQLYQLNDPILGKPNCVQIDNYEIEVRIPLPKPKELS